MVFFNLWIEIKIATLSRGVIVLPFSSSSMIQSSAKSGTLNLCPWNMLLNEPWSRDNTGQKGESGTGSWMGTAHRKSCRAGRECLSLSLPTFPFHSPKYITPSHDLQMLTVLTKWKAPGSMCCLHPDRISCWKGSHFTVGGRLIIPSHGLLEAELPLLPSLSLKGTSRLHTQKRWFKYDRHKSLSFLSSQLM